MEDYMIWRKVSRNADLTVGFLLLGFTNSFVISKVHMIYISHFAMLEL